MLKARERGKMCSGIQNKSREITEEKRFQVLDVGLGKSSRTVSGGVECMMLGLRMGEVLGICLPALEKLHWHQWVKQNLKSRS